MAILNDRSALGAAPATGDLLFVTDVSDTTDAATGTDKKMTVANLHTGIASETLTLTNKTIDGDSNTLSNLDLGNEVDWAAADDVTTASAFTTGDKILIFEAGVGMRKVDYSDLPGAGAGLSNVVEDTTPQLGGQLDVNGNALGDGTRELLTFTEDASAVNHINIENEATGSGPIITAAGDDTNVDLNIGAKGTGLVKLSAGDGLDANSHAIGDSTEVDNGNSATADTIDWGAGNFQKSTMTGNCTYTFTAPPVKGRFQLMLVQDGTGSRTATWPASVKWPGGTAPTLSTAASAIDIITFYYDGTSYYGVDSLNFS